MACKDEVMVASTTTRTRVVSKAFHDPTVLVAVVMGMLLAFPLTAPDTSEIFREHPAVSPTLVMALVRKNN